MGSDDLDGDGFSVPEDCDDGDASVSPAAVEWLGDAVDSDCDGGADATTAGGEGSLWVDPRPPSMAWEGSHFVVAATAAELTHAGVWTPRPWVTVTLPADAGPAAESLGPVVYRESPDGVVPGRVDAEGAGGNTLLSWSYETDIGLPFSSGYLVAAVATVDPAFATVETASDWSIAPLYEAVANDVARGSLGRNWSASCGAEIVQALALDVPAGGPGDLAPPDPDALPVDTCFWASTPDDAQGLGTVVTCAAPPGSCRALEYEPAGTPPRLRPSSPSAWEQRQVRHGHHRSGWTLLLDEDPGVLLETPSQSVRVLEDFEVHLADAHWRSSPLVELVALVWAEPLVDDGAGARLLLAWGPPDALQTTEIDPSPADAGEALTGLAVAVSPERIGTVVSTSTDRVLWRFWGW